MASTKFAMIVAASAHGTTRSIVIFIKPKNRDASEIVDLMKKDKKILIKVYKDIPDMGDCLRVSIGESEVMDIFIEALEDIDR